MNYDEFFQRNLGIFEPEEQERIKDAKVLIIGCGGIGGVIAIALARSSVGHFVLMEPEVYELSSPADAIRREERTTEPTSISNRTGILRWPVDVAKCYLFWQENGTDCSNCVAVCPWAFPIRPWL